jgi:hypothetical protein
MGIRLAGLSHLAPSGWRFDGMQRSGGGMRSVSSPFVGDGRSCANVNWPVTRSKGQQCRSLDVPCSARSHLHDRSGREGAVTRSAVHRIDSTDTREDASQSRSGVIEMVEHSGPSVYFYPIDGCRHGPRPSCVSSGTRVAGALDSRRSVLLLSKG